jgi:hypothetical protein
MLSLTRDTVEDSATVRVVTIVTLIYLPSSFVSVSFDEGYLTRKLTLPVFAGNQFVHFSNVRWIRVPSFQAILGFYSHICASYYAHGWKLAVLH